jgi:uncharacterized protein (TIGR00251 family)
LIYCRPSAAGIRLDVRVVPRAKSTGVAGVRDGALLVRLTAPPADEAANRQLKAFLAEQLRVPTRAVRIVSGERARRKVVEVAGVDEAACLEAFGAAS